MLPADADQETPVLEVPWTVAVNSCMAPVVMSASAGEMVMAISGLVLTTTVAKPWTVSPPAEDSAITWYTPGVPGAV
jgi:hypothetical protein